MTERSRSAAGMAAAMMLGVAVLSPVRAAPVSASAQPAEAARDAKTGAPKQGPGFGPALFDKSKPIEITSDRLDVDQEAKTAVFQGRVDAIQGDIHLRADRLKVYYEAIADNAAPTGSTAPPHPVTRPAPAAEGVSTGDATDPMANGGRIKRMDVDGNVFVSSPTETASGSKGVYNADTGKITLLGDVILTRGANVIRGTKLSIDVDTGHSVIESTAGSDGGRVKGLFVPKKNQEDGTKAPGSLMPAP